MADDVALRPVDKGSRASESGRGSGRALAAALWSAVLALPFGALLSEVEDYQWRGKGGGAPWVFGSSFYPKAALFAFSFPYIVLAIELSVGVSFAGFLAIVVGVTGLIFVSLMLLSPLGFFYGLAKVAASLSFLTGVVYGLALMAIFAGFIAFVRYQFVLIRQGTALEALPATSSWRGAPRSAAIVLMVAYVLVWCESIAAPDQAKEQRSRAQSDSIAAAAAARAKLPAGAPLQLLRIAEADSSAPRGLGAPLLAVDAEGNLFVAPTEQPWGERTRWISGPLVALDSTGAVRWRSDSAQITGGAPTVRVNPNSAVIYLGGSKGSITAIRSRNGAVLWSLSLETTTAGVAMLYTPLVLGHGDILVAASSSDPHTTFPLVRLSADGAARWRAKIGTAVSAPISGAGETTYVLTRWTEWPGRDILCALDGNGRNVWTRQLSNSQVHGALARADDGTLFAAGENVEVFSADGVPLTVIAKPANSVIPTGNEELLLVSDTAVQRFRRGRADNQWIQEWSYPAARIGGDERVAGAILGPPGRLILSTSSRVVVLRLGDGQPLSEYAPVDSDAIGYQPRRFTPRLMSLSSPVRGPDGTIYVADRPLRVYAFRDTTRD